MMGRIGNISEQGEDLFYHKVISVFDCPTVTQLQQALTLLSYLNPSHPKELQLNLTQGVEQHIPISTTKSFPSFLHSHFPHKSLRLVESQTSVPFKSMTHLVVLSHDPKSHDHQRVNQRELVTQFEDGIVGVAVIF